MLEGVADTAGVWQNNVAGRTAAEPWVSAGTTNGAILSDNGIRLVLRRG